MKPKSTTTSSIPNWLLYSAVILLLVLGALKIFWGLSQVYR